MSYEEFWDGDCCKAPAYRKSFEIIQENKSFDAWLQGEYIYEALVAVSPVFNAFSKQHKPFPYTKEPHALTHATAKERKVRDEKQKLDNGLAAVQAMAQLFNRGHKNLQKGDDK